jgi:hypothetical protein
MKFWKITFLIGLIAILTAFIMCTRDNRHQRPRQLIETGSSFHLFIRNTVANVDVMYDTIYHGATSRKFKVTDFRYYISNIRAIREDGAENRTKQSVILANPRQKDYNLGSLPEGVYNGLRFTLGLDSVTNHGDPTVFEAGNPLAIQTPSMHWDWNSGYLFMKIEGKVDTTSKGTGAPVTEFFYHFGMDTMKRTISVPIKFSVSASSNNGVHLKFDLGFMFAGVDMRSEFSTHSFDNQPLAVRMADRWQGAFSPDN